MAGYQAVTGHQRVSGNIEIISGNNNNENINRYRYKNNKKTMTLFKNNFCCCVCIFISLIASIIIPGTSNFARCAFYWNLRTINIVYQHFFGKIIVDTSRYIHTSILPRYTFQNFAIWGFCSLELLRPYCMCWFPQAICL